MRNEEYSKLVEDYKEILQYIDDNGLNKELINHYVYKELIFDNLICNDLTPEELLIVKEIKSIQAIVFPYIKSLPLFHGGSV